MSQKKILLLLILILTFGIFIVFFLIVINRPQLKNINPINPKVGKIEQKAEETKLWKDELGFVFEYPANLKIDPNANDQTYYANLDISANGKKGRIKITVDDFLDTTIEDWINKNFKNGNISVLDTYLGEVKAKKWVEKNKKQLVTAADYDGLLFLIVSDITEDKYWQKINEIILKSFSLKGITVKEEEERIEESTSGEEELSIEGDFEGEEIVE